MTPILNHFSTFMLANLPGLCSIACSAADEVRLPDSPRVSRRTLTKTWFPTTMTTTTSSEKKGLDQPDWWCHLGNCSVHARRCVKSIRLFVFNPLKLHRQCSCHGVSATIAFVLEKIVRWWMWFLAGIYDKMQTREEGSLFAELRVCALF